MKSKYYDIQNILKKKADYNVIFGKRSNGKTFGACEVALTSHINNGARCAYIRRYAEDITPKRLRNLFTPHPVKEITEGNYNCIIYKSNRFSLALADEKGDITEQEEIPFCQAFSLNTWERDKGVDNGRFDYIIFDEFITRGNYLPNEFVIFCNVLSTLMRDRDGACIFMLGNTVSPYCPYFEEMGLSEIIAEMEQGEIKTTKTREGLKIAIEFAEDSDNTKKINKYFSFSNPRLEMITSGKWEMKNYPHLKARVTNDLILARFFVEYLNHVFIGDIIQYNGDIFVHFHDGDLADYDAMRHFSISDEPRINPRHSTSVYQPTWKAQKLFLSLLSEQRCFYSTNAIGERVRSWLNHERNLKKIFLD